MANSIVERLIAAGASPQRAQSFAAQFAASQPTTSKPRDIQDAFDQQLFDLSYSLYPNTFKVPRAGDDLFDDYARYILTPEGYTKVEQKAFATNAPNFNAAKKGTAYEQKLAIAVEKGFSPTQIREAIMQDFTNNVPELLTFPVTGTKSVTDAAADLADTLFKEYADFDVKKVDVLQKELDKNKNYKFGLPDPKLSYGAKTDFNAGTIDFRTHPSVTKILDKRKSELGAGLQATYGAAGPQSTAAAGIALPSPQEERELLNLVKTKAKPFVDEVKRREYLKKKSIK